MSQEIDHKHDRISGLDGLRALAALSVFAVHFNQIVQFDSHLGPIDISQLLANGDHGVSLFFILSGFLLSMPFWGAVNSGAAMPGLRAYGIRRLARIIPPYYVALTVLIYLGNYWKIPGALSDILLHYSFLYNYTEFSIFSINPPFWTLAVEVQFYILLPCIFLLIRRMSAWPPLGVIFALGLGAYTLHYWLTASVTRIIQWPLQPWLTWIRPYGAVLSHSLVANLPHFLLGVAGGWLFPKMNIRETIDSRTIQWAYESLFWFCLVAVILLLGTGLEEYIQIPYGQYGLPIVPILLAMLIMSAPATRIAKRGLDGPPLRMLGVISYGIYIYHLPCLNLIDRYMTAGGMDATEHWILFGLISFLVSSVIAAFSYIALEKPIMEAVRKLI